MTLVARITLGGAPFLIGDALISSSEIANPDVASVECELPFIGEINRVLAAKERLFRVDLCQKLHVFEGRLAVGWSSNDASQAERALKVLREVAKKPDLTLSDVQDALSAIDPDRIKSLSLVGLLLRAVNGDQISVSVFRHDAVTENISGFGEVTAAGSGARTFIQMLQRHEEPLSTKANDPWTALGVLGSLLTHELSTGQSIDERWGGAFETVSFSRHTGRLEKLDNVLHLFWVWRDNRQIDFRPKFYLARYFDELLVLRSVEYEAGENRTIKQLKSKTLKLVPSLLRPVRDEDELNVGHVDFAYDHVCCHIDFPGPQGQPPRGAMILAGPRGSSYDIDVSVAEDGSLRLRLPSDTVANIIEAAKPHAALLEQLEPR